MSSNIPGAWSSTWTLDTQERGYILDTEKTPKIPDSHASYSSLSQHQGLENFDLALFETPSMKNQGVSIESNMHISNPDVSVAEDDASSIPSDDFYSVISHEDTESTLFPSVVVSSSSISKQNDSLNGLLSPLDFSSHFDPSELSSCLHTSAQDDVYAPENLRSATSMLPTVSPLIEDNSHRSERMDSVNYSVFPSANISAHCDQRFTLDALAAIDNVTHISGNESPVDPHGYECDSSSSQSDSLPVSRDISNLIARLGTGANVSLPSIRSERSWSQSSSRNQSQRDTHHGHAQDELFNVQTVPLRLSQPSGGEPWTLSLDPTMTPTESEATSSQASTASLSHDDNCIPEDESGYVRSRDTLPSIASFQSNSSPHEENILITPRDSESSKQGQPVQPKFNPGPSSLAYDRTNDAVRSKNLIQKTKELCSKFKKFVSLKAIKERKSRTAKDKSGILRKHLKDQVESEMTFHRQDFPVIPGSPLTSVENHLAYRRTAKISAPSVALSYTPDYTVTDNVLGSGEKHTYEYHARPKTLQEIRSKRRFSLPAFARPSSPRPLNPRTVNPVPSTRQRRAGPNLSSDPTR